MKLLIYVIYLLGAVTFLNYPRRFIKMNGRDFLTLYNWNWVSVRLQSAKLISGYS